MSKQFWVTAVVVFAATVPAKGADHTEVEVRLRDMLRQTTVELRDAQSQNSELRAKLDALSAQQAAPVPRPSTTHADAAVLHRSQREVEELRAALDEAHRALDETHRALDERDEALGRWKKANEQTEQLARTRDADAKRLTEQQRVLEERVTSCGHDNSELVGIAQDILERYRKKGVWDSVRDAEPLTGVHHVKLETLAQQYHAKIIDLQTPSNH